MLSLLLLLLLLLVIQCFRPPATAAVEKDATLIGHRGYNTSGRTSGS